MEHKMLEIKRNKVEYKKQVSFKGNVQNLFKVLEMAFIANGFENIKKSDNVFEAKKNRELSNTKITGSPLGGYSFLKVVYDYERKILEVQASFDERSALIKFLVLFLLGMAIFFELLFGFVILREEQRFFSRYIVPVLPLLPWLVILPLLNIFLKHQGHRKLNAFIDNAVAAAKN